MNSNQKLFVYIEPSLNSCIQQKAAQNSHRRASPGAMIGSSDRLGTCGVHLVYRSPHNHADQNSLQSLEFTGE
mgnify:CR=1